MPASQHATSQTAYLDFWGALRVCISGDLTHPMSRGYLKKFEHYRTQRPVASPDLTFNIGSFHPPEKGTFLFNEYRIGDGYLYKQHTYKIAKWSSLLRGLDTEQWHVNLWGNRAAGVMVPHLTMTSLTQLALSFKGWISVHAATLVNAYEPSQSVVIAGRRGVGKTTLTGRLLNQNYQMVSEDRVFVKNKQIRGLRVPVNLKYDRRNPQIAKLSKASQWRLKRNHLLAKATRNYFTLHEPVSLRELIPGQLRDTCTLSKVLYLQSGPALEIHDTADPAMISKQIVLGNALDDASVTADCLAYQFCFSSFSSLRSYRWDADQHRLEAALSQPSVTCNYLTVPINPTASQWDKVLEVVRG